MKVRARLLRAGTVLTVIIFNFLVGSAQQTAGQSSRIDRLVALAKLWAAVKYFHPYLAYRDNIDWDAALVRAIPKVDAARDRVEYSAAVEGMLNELGDPVTRVLNIPTPMATNSSSLVERQPTFQKNPDGVLVVAMTNYADFQDFVGTGEKLEALKKELPTARAVVFDLRPAATPSESEQGFASDGISRVVLPVRSPPYLLICQASAGQCTLATFRRMAPLAGITVRVFTFKAVSRSGQDRAQKTYRWFF
jgi:hypothetical protein